MTLISTPIKKLSTCAILTVKPFEFPKEADILIINQIKVGI